MYFWWIIHQLRARIWGNIFMIFFLCDLNKSEALTPQHFNRPTKLHTMILFIKIDFTNLESPNYLSLME
jgi:hypothetical protein